MSAHAPAHEALLQRVLLGEAGAAERAELEACGTCQVELARLLALDARLRAGAARERETVALARSAAGEGDAARVRATLAAALAERRTRSRRRGLFLVLAAAVVLASGLTLRALWRPHPTGARHEVILGGKIPCLSPVGKVEHGYDVFAWKYPQRPASAHFELHLYPFKDGQRDKLLQRIPDLTEPRWTPTPEEERALPDELYWEVVLIDDITLEELESGFASASR